VAPRTRTLVADVGLAALVLAAFVVELWARDDIGPEDRPWTALALLTLEAVVLVPRRRHPVVVWLAEGIIVSTYGLGPWPDPHLHYGVLVAMYTVAAYTSAATSRRAALVTATVMGLVLLVDPEDTDVLDWAFNFLSVGTAWLVGENLRTSRAVLTGNAERAVAEERVRLARELHDVTAHHVSVIAIQAEAGQALLPDDPGRAAEALERIAESSREALGDLRRLLGVLRSEDETGERAPRPGLAALPQLVAHVEAAGVPVALHVEGEPTPLATAVDLSAYRIVQEALTNVVRHAGPAHATVTVRYGPEDVGLEVSDDGVGPYGNGGGGLGLTGMRERATLLGGDFDAGPRPGGGFSVRARLPA
jgi:signal transduction histidine kinase